MMFAYSIEILITVLAVQKRPQFNAVLEKGHSYISLLMYKLYCAWPYGVSLASHGLITCAKPSQGQAGFQPRDVHMITFTSSASIGSSASSAL